MTPPSRPENLNELEGTERTAADEVCLCRLVHYHYIKNTEEYNKLHYYDLTDPMCMLRSRLFHYATNPWEGETLELKVALIRATERWETLTGGGVSCPVVFDADDVRETTELNEVQRKADEIFEVWRNMLGLGPEGWVPTQDYEEALAFCKADEVGGVNGGHGGGTGGDHGTLALGRHGRREIYVTNRARYSAVLYLVCCCIYGQLSKSHQWEMSCRGGIR